MQQELQQYLPADIVAFVVNDYLMPSQDQVIRNKMFVRYQIAHARSWFPNSMPLKVPHSFRNLLQYRKTLVCIYCEKLCVDWVPGGYCCERFFERRFKFVANVKRRLLESPE